MQSKHFFSALIFPLVSFVGLSSCSSSINDPKPQTLTYSIEKAQWVNDTAGFSSVSLYLKGKTNAKKMAVTTRGDGVVGDQAINLNVLGEFDDSIPIAFSHVGGIILQTSTNVKFYGSNNDSQYVLLGN